MKMPATITLYGFGPAFGLPDPSPFVTKVEVLLKMAASNFGLTRTAFARRRSASCPISTTAEPSSPTRPSSAGISRKNIGSISTVDCRLKSVRSLGRSRRWRRSISIGQSFMRAGMMTEISTRGLASSSNRYLRRCDPW